MKDFFMTFNSNEDLYIQIYKKIKKDIVEGTLKKDTHLPSRRKMASSLNVSVNTINNAYDILLEEGYIYSLEKVGYFVSDFSLPKNIKTNINNEILIEEKNKYDFTTSNPDYNLFPRNQFNKISKDIIYNSSEFMERSNLKGNIKLRLAIQKLLYEQKGINASIDQIIIYDSTTSIINDLRRFFESPITAIENPGYFMNKKDYVPINIDNKGISVTELSKVKAKLVITTPFSHFPTGIKMPLDRKKEIIDYLEKNDAYLIEDSLDSQFRNQAYITTALFNMSDRVIFTESFSRGMFPGLGISYMVIPNSLVNKFKPVTSNISSLNELILADFINSDIYTRHINKLRLAYSKKKKLILELLDNNLFEVISDEAYCSIIVKVKKDYEFQSLKEKGIKIHQLNEYSNTPTNYLVLGFSSIPLEEIPKAIAYLQKSL